jgi:NAD+ diphosphatase
VKPNPNTFANYPLDRASHHRRDEAWLESALASDAARLVLFHKLAPFLTTDGKNQCVGWMAGHAKRQFAGDGVALFLGLGADGAPHFACEAPEEFPLADRGAFTDLRATAAAGAIPPGDIAILGAARWLFDWHKRHGFCAVCGAKTDIQEGGWKRWCPNCKAEHFPRVDPVAIMAPTFNDKLCLGRSAHFPQGMYSALAGFIEPGESIEEGCAREVLEEVGLKVVSTRYHSTQPWPFPSSLMIGILCEVENDKMTVDTFELEEARWFTRDDIAKMIAGKHENASIPPPMAIAHHLIEAWYDEGRSPG